jgi:hypothetical protein
MKPKRGETADQTVARWANELLACQRGDFRQALECVDWLRARLVAMQKIEAGAELVGFEGSN